MAFSVLLLCVVLILSFAAVVLRRKCGTGPRGLPLLGNLLQVLGNKPYMALTAWVQRYGPVYQVQLGSHRAVVISSIEVAREALVSRGRAVAGRPDFTTMAMLHQQETRFVFSLHADHVIKRYRKTVLADTRKRLASMETLVMEEMDKMAAKLFPAGCTETVDDIRHLLHCMATNIALGYAFGITLDLDDADLQKWEGVLDDYRELLNWFRLENFLPHSHLFLRDFANQAAEFRKASIPLYKSAIAQARQKKQEGRENECGLMSALLDMFEESTPGEKDDDIISILRDVMFGGSDGSYQPLIWMVLCVARDPQLQEKIQGEINDVIGSERMPSLVDREHMPYTEACVREVLRQSDIAVLGIPRRTTENVTLCGQHVPKDTLVIVNAYAIHRDPRHWKNPLDFDPSRFLDENRQLRPLSELSYLPFSAGTRACAGQSFQRQLLPLLFTAFFQRFEISSAPCEPVPEMVNDGGSFNPEIKPFKVMIKRRIP